MKRMVENSEKIEELADAVENSKTTLTFNKQVNFDENINVNGVARYNNGLEVNNGDLVTSNITTTNGTKLNIYDDSMYAFGNANNVSLSIINLGTALLILGSINATSASNNYWLLTLNIPYNETYADSISTGDECRCSTEEYGNSTKIMLNFNKDQANPQKSTYKFSFVVGYDGGQL